MKHDWMPIFAVSSNFTLDVLYNGSGYELIFAECPVHSSVKWKETIKKSISIKLNKKLLNTDICSAS